MEPEEKPRTYRSFALGAAARLGAWRRHVLGTTIDPAGLRTEK